MYKVLIVEDDPMVAMINEQYVNRNDRFCVVGKCKDGASALSFLEEKHADLIIMDVFMPVMNGIETLKEIRKKGYPVAVIMVTAANDSTTFEEAIRMGAVDYLVKPFAFDRFQLSLEKFVSASSVLHEGKSLNQNTIDKIMTGQGSVRSEAPKGIQENTKTLILKCLASSGDWMSGEDISEETGLSAVTVRRYMNHLVQTGDVTGQMNYETGGRPSMQYIIRK